MKAGHGRIVATGQLGRLWQQVVQMSAPARPPPRANASVEIIAMQPIPMMADAASATMLLRVSIDLLFQVIKSEVIPSNAGLN